MKINHRKVVLLCCVLIFVVPSIAIAYSCHHDKNESWAYDARFHIKDGNGEEMGNAFVYMYPLTEWKHNPTGGCFYRTDSRGRTATRVDLCLPKGQQPPKFIKVKCVFKGPYDGSDYSIESETVKYYLRKKGAAVTYPVFLIKK